MKPLLGSIQWHHVETPLGFMIALSVIIVLGVVIKFKVAPNLGAIIVEVKKQLFTISGMIAAFIHLMIVVGVLSSWIMFNIKVLGNDVSISTPEYRN